MNKLFTSETKTYMFANPGKNECRKIRKSDRAKRFVSATALRTVSSTCVLTA